MNKGVKHVAIVVILAVVLIVFVVMYTVWRDCDAVGGITVRGLFWLECISH